MSYIINSRRQNFLHTSRMDVLLGHGQVRVDSGAGPIPALDRPVNNVTLNAREDRRTEIGRGKSAVEI